MLTRENSVKFLVGAFIALTAGGALVIAVLWVASAIGVGIYEQKWSYVLVGAIFGYIFFLSDWGWWRRRGGPK